MSKIKLDVATQNLKGLNRRVVQTRNSVEQARAKAERIAAEIASLEERRQNALAEAAKLTDHLQGLEEYADEVSTTVKRLFWELQGPDSNELDSSAKNQVYYEFLVKNNLGGIK